MKIGTKLRIPINLTVDPLNKRGETGTLISKKLGVYTLKFADGKEGKYFANIWENYAKGGKIDENAEMVLNQNTQIKHHTDELKKVVKAGAKVPAWVVAKINRSANDISDATHYLDGETKMEKGGKVEKVMKEFKEGKLHSGSKKGPIVKSRKQAIAIALSEERASMKKGWSHKKYKK